jgi:hypothetical protein
LTAARPNTVGFIADARKYRSISRNSAILAS